MICSAYMYVCVCMCIRKRSRFLSFQTDESPLSFRFAGPFPSSGRRQCT